MQPTPSAWPIPRMGIHFRFPTAERSDLTPRDAAKKQQPQTLQSFGGEKKKRKEQPAGDAPACKSPLSVPTKGDKSLLAWPIYPHLRGNKPQPEPFHIPNGTTPRPPFPPGPPRPRSAPCPSRGAWEARGESRRGTRPISGRRGTARGRHWIAAGPGGGAGGRDGAGPSGRRRRLLKGTYRPDGPVLARPPAPPARAVGGGEPRGGSGPLRTDGGGGERRARGSKAPSGRAAIGRSALSRPSRCLRRGVEGAARRAAALCEPGRRRGRAGAAVEARGGAGGTEGGGRRRGAARGLRGADAGLRSGEPRGMGA